MESAQKNSCIYKPPVIPTSFFKLTFWFPKSRSLKPRQGHLWVQTRSLWRTWYLYFPNHILPSSPRSGCPPTDCGARSQVKAHPTRSTQGLKSVQVLELVTGPFRTMKFKGKLTNIFFLPTKNIYIYIYNPHFFTYYNNFFVIPTKYMRVSNGYGWWK